MALSPNQYRKEFITSAAAADILSQLEQMESSPLYATKSSYSPGAEGGVSFCDKHFVYISTHPNVRPGEYMANLRLMTKLR